MAATSAGRLPFQSSVGQLAHESTFFGFGESFQARTWSQPSEPFEDFMDVIVRECAVVDVADSALTAEVHTPLVVGPAS